MIKQCNCPSDYQDKRYGKNNRVHNESRKGAVCCICGKVKDIKK